MRTAVVAKMMLVSQCTKFHLYNFPDFLFSLIYSKFSLLGTQITWDKALKKYKKL